MRTTPLLTAAPGRVSVEGDIDRMTLELVEREAERQLEENGPDLVLDLRATTFIDLWGLRMIEALERRARERGGELVLVVASYAVRRLLELAPPPPSVRVVFEQSEVGAPSVAA